MSELVSVFFLGAVVGSLYALAAFGLVLTFRTSGVFNFAQGALGMFFAFLFFQLTQGGRVNLVFFSYEQTWRLPKLLGLLAVVGVLAPAFGLLLDRVLFSRLRSASTVVQIVATIGLLISLQGIVGVVWGGGTTLTPRSIFPRHTYEPLGVRLSAEQLLTIAVALGLAAVTLAFLRLSPLGIRMRAVVDRPEVSELMGVDSRRISALAWAVGTGFAALAGILVVPFYGTLDVFTLIFLGIAVATAAAVLARLESLPLALAGGMGIGMAQFAIQRYGSSDLARQLRPSIPFIVLFAVLFLPRRWPDVGGPTYRPAPRRGADLTFAGRAARIGVLAAIVLAVPFLGGGGWQTDVLGGSWASIIALVPPMAIIFLSLVLLSGYAGQVSLCQAALAGFGAFIAAHLVADWSWPFLLAVPVAGLATVPLGALLASRAARLPPLYLGFATLAFAALMDEVAFNSKRFSNQLQGIFFNPPELLSGPRAYYLFGLAVFALMALFVTNLRDGRTGLALAAMRDSPSAVASVGEGVAMLKLKVFCLSAFLAGVGGAMLAGASGQATSIRYFQLNSLLFLALAVIGGIGSWSGALAGATAFTLLQPLLHQPWVLDSFVGETLFNGQLEQLLPVFFGIGAIGLANNPNGMVEQTREGFARFRERIRGRGRSLQPEGSSGPLELQRTDQGDGDGDRRPVAYPHARHYHRPGCVFGTGKEGKAVTAAKARTGPLPGVRTRAGRRRRVTATAPQPIPPPGQAPMPAANAADLLRRNATDPAVADRPAVHTPERTWTHREYLEESCRWAQRFLELRPPAGRPFHAGVLLDNVPEYLFAYGAAALTGATVVGLNPTRRGDNLRRDLEHTDVAFVLTDPSHRDLLGGIDVPLVDVGEGPGVDGDDPGLEPDPGTTWALIFTSGTSDAPKAVICSQRRLLTSAVRLGMIMELGPDDVGYVCMPLFHSNAVMVGWAPSIVYGGSIGLAPRFSASGWLPDVRRYGATYWNYTGKPLAYILATPERPDDAENTLRIAYGNEGSPQLVEGFGRRFGVRVIDAYGSTEGGVAVNRDVAPRPGALGMAPANIKVVDDQGVERARARFDEHGRLVNAEECVGEMINTEGAGPFEGYYRNEDANRKATRNGWYWSGDLGYLDDDGYIYFAGRTADWIRVDGENFPAAPIENALLRHPDVVTAAVYGVPDEQAGDQAMACVVLQEGAAFDGAGFATWLDSQADLGPKWRPRYVRVTAAMPTTGTNKIVKRQLAREKYRLDLIGDDALFVRGRGEAAYRPFTADDEAAVRDGLSAAGRERFWDL